MRFLKYFALLALASIPLLLVERKKEEEGATIVNDDDIFERELRAE